MEYEKQIEIKLEGNNCIINFPKDNNNISLQNNSLTGIEDISFSVSVTSDEEKNSKNNLCIYNKDNNVSNSKQYLYSNEKSKLEITYQSIFNSELKSESSNMKTPLLLLNSKNNCEIQQKKDSVVKKLNFDINMNNSEIPNINIRKLPTIKRNNMIKKISKNLNKEYFIHEKIYASNKNVQRILLDRKLKENSIKNSNNNNTFNKNKTQIIDNNIDFLNNDSFNGNKYQITENLTSKGNLNFLANKVNNNNANLLLNKCSSKPNLSNMRHKLNDILKLNSKEKENINIYKEKPKNNILKELDIMPKIMCNDSMNINNNIGTKNFKKNKIIYPSLTSGNNNNTNLNVFNSFNKSANNNKIKPFNINENSNTKTPLILNKQIILSTPKTNSYSCSTSYSAKNNKIQNDINISSEKDPILVKIEAHNSLMKNFLMNKNNFKNMENKENISNNMNNENYKFFVNKSNNHTSEKTYGKKYEDESINDNKGIRVKKFNTDFKLPINKYNKISLLTDRNIKNNIKNCNVNKIYLKDAKNIFKKNVYDNDIINSIRK